MRQLLITTGFAVLAAVAAGCDSEPDGRCQMYMDCCTALQQDVRFSSHPVVQERCPPQGDMSEGDACYQTRTQMISDIIQQGPLLREYIPSSCM